MPDRPRIVVVNTTPIISLALIGKLDLLMGLYGEVIVPPAVEAEIFAGGSNRIGVSKHAVRVGLKVTGVLGVLLRAKDQELIQDIKPLREKLQKNGIRLAPELIKETLRLAKELYKTS